MLITFPGNYPTKISIDASLKNVSKETIFQSF